MTDDASLPVLIVGAGPTGLALALILRRYGVKVRLIDRAPSAATVSKALAVWSGSLEAIAGLGVVDDFLAAGARLKALKVGDGRFELAALAIGEGIDSPYPFPILLPQSRTEAILTGRALELGVAVERGVELTQFDQDGLGVSATLRRPDGTAETLRCAFLVGADGARSTVRQALGIAFDGYTEPQTFLLGDVRISGEIDHSCIYLWWHHGGSVALFPYENAVWRVFALRGDDSDQAPPTLAELQAQIDRHGPPGLRLEDPVWLSAFRINERLAARYRVGHVFLAGDAAHIHSPAGGQGMNTGIQDAANLGWKLALALRGRSASPLLLDSYEAERRPVARAVIAGAAQKLHVAFHGSGVARALRDVAVAVLGNLPAVQRKLQIELSETEVAYHDGPLVALGAPPRRTGRGDVGTRARDAAIVDAAGGPSTLWPILSRGHHTLLLFEDGRPITLDGAAAHLGPDLVPVRLDPRTDPGGAARERYRMDGPGFVLVRPDQVVAVRGRAGDLGALANYLDPVLGRREA
jgi:2-polyprenyl-6-methoxyphenol hydroxylase-like FAD-dependent oxidoreductase